MSTVSTGLIDMLGGFPLILRQSWTGSEGLGCHHVDGQRVRRDSGGCCVEGLVGVFSVVGLYG